MVLFFTYIPFVVNHTINATPLERLQQTLPLHFSFCQMIPISFFVIDDLLHAILPYSSVAYFAEYNLSLHLPPRTSFPPILINFKIEFDILPIPLVAVQSLFL